MKRCQICVMPSVDQRIVLDENGVCNICKKNTTSQDIVQASTGKMCQKVLENEIIKFKGIGEYDSIIGLSGGKDSTMALYISIERLNLRPLAVFIDNGFSVKTMYDNVINATDKLGVDLLIFRPRIIKRLFKHLLLRKAKVYYCRICNALIDYYIRMIALRYRIPFLLGGHTKGQDFIKGTELFWIYRTSDENLLNEIKGIQEFDLIVEMFASLSLYFYDNFASIKVISPFHYYDYNESDILQLISKELGFRLPEVSWPVGSTNCLFNFISQDLAVKYFGYSQHETEISTLIRKKEISRSRGLEIIETPIQIEQVEMALERMALTYNDYKKFVGDSLNP